MYHRPTLAFVVLFLAGTSWTASAHAGLLDSTLTLDQQTAWDGFEPDFEPEWDGETVVAETYTNDDTTTTTTNAWGPNGCMIATTMPLPYRWSVRRVSSFASARTGVDARFDYGGESYVASAGDSNSGRTYNSADNAHYAEVVTPGGATLANGSAIAYQSASIGDFDFRADGHVSSAAVLADGIIDARAEASGNSGFYAIYELELDTAFSLDLNLAGLGDADVSFAAVDLLTDETIFSYSPTEDAARREVGLTGVLEAGKYRFDLQTETDTWINASGEQDAGGLAMYDLSLDFEAEKIDNGLQSVELEPATLEPSVLGTFVVKEGSPDGFVSPQAPEPGTSAMLLIAALAFCHIRPARRPPKK